MIHFQRPVVGFTVPGLPLAALTLAILSATGCSVQAPNETTRANDTELALASEVADEQSAVSSRNLNVSANFNPATGQLIVAGQLPRAASVRIEDGASNQLLGVVQAVSPFAVAGSETDDRAITAAGVAPWQLVLNQQQLAQLQLFTVPCTLRLQTPQGTVLVPVQSVVSPGQTLNCANGATGQAEVQAQELTLSRSTWNPLTGSLIITGTGATPRQTVTFMDAATGQIVGLDEANATGAFRLRLTSVAVPPCNIRVVADSRTVDSVVIDAPAACALPGAILSNINLAPNIIITTPSTESMVIPGTTVSFDAVGIDPDNNIPLTYYWDFDGAGPSSDLRNPIMTFSRPGVYRVRATVTDALGAIDLTPDVRTIIVQAAFPGFPGSPGSPGSPGTPALVPAGQIVLPAANTTVTVGQAVSFSAIGTSSNGLGLTYVWNFGGGAANAVQQEPGPVIFTKPGTYTVTMTAVDQSGLSDPTPDSRIITVLAGVGTGPGTGTGTSNVPPNGDITQPLNDNVTYQVGQSVVFSAIGADPDANLPISYLWDFGGAAQPSAQQTTSVVFSQPGTYRVTLYVFDSLGAVDPTPAVRTINVQGVGTSQPGTLAPESTILSPLQDVQITVGQSVAFSGTGSDPTAGSALIYAWDFDGGAPNTTVQNPGAVTFSKAGSYRVRLVARNSLGRVDRSPAERMVTVTDPLQFNLPPAGQIISPLTDQAIQAGQSIQFSATGTDPDGTSALRYEWDFGSAAPRALVANPGAVIFSQAGTYLVSLRVKDSFGLADPTPEVRRVVVTSTGAPNLMLEAIISSPATDLTINMGDSLNFMGSGVDPDGGQVTYLWTAASVGGSFSGVTIPSPTQRNAGVLTFSAPGTYEVKLAVSHNHGLTETALETRTITVRDMTVANPAPNGQIFSPTLGTVTSITVGQSVSFSGSATDANSAVAPSFYWDFDGAAADSTLQNPGSVTFSRPGTYTVALRVTDDRGAPDATPDMRTIFVRSTGIASGVAPQGNIVSPAGDLQISLGQSLNFSATGTDGDNNLPLSFHWNFDGAAPASNAQDAGSVTFTKPGIYNVSMTVTDSTGVSAAVPSTKRITVLSSGGSGTAVNAPNGTIISPANFSNVQVGQSVSFQAMGVDPSGSSVLNYNWNFGSSGVQSSSLQYPTVTFSIPGTYTVTLGVSNQQGIVDPTPETRTINVVTTGSQGTSVMPDGMISVPATNQIVTVGDTVHFMGEVMTATAPGQTFRYVWNFMGGAPTLTDRSPGDVVFNIPGTYQLSFTVMDSQGLADPTPATRTIKVNPR